MNPSPYLLQHREDAGVPDHARIHRVLAIGRLDAAQPRLCRAVAVLQIEHLGVLCGLARLLDKLVGDALQLGDDALNLPLAQAHQIANLDLACGLGCVAEHADLHGIAIAPHGTAKGILGLAALIQVCATLPDNLIAFEYLARFEPFWYDITEGFDGVPVRNGLIDVPDRPGLGVDLLPKQARKYLSAGDSDFFD